MTIKLIAVIILGLLLGGCKPEKEIVYKERVVTVTVFEEVTINENGIADLCRDYALEYFNLESSGELQSFIDKYTPIISNEVRDSLLEEFANMVFMSNLTFDTYYMDSISDGSRVWVYLQVESILDGNSYMLTDIMVSFKIDEHGVITYVNPLVVPAV